MRSQPKIRRARTRSSSARGSSTSAATADVVRWTRGSMDRWTDGPGPGRSPAVEKGVRNKPSVRVVYNGLCWWHCLTNIFLRFFLGHLNRHRWNPVKHVELFCQKTWLVKFPNMSKVLFSNCKWWILHDVSKWWMVDSWGGSVPSQPVSHIIGGALQLCLLVYRPTHWLV